MRDTVVMETDSFQDSERTGGNVEVDVRRLKSASKSFLHMVAVRLRLTFLVAQNAVAVDIQ